MSGMLGMLKGKAASKVMGGGGTGQSDAALAAQDQQSIGGQIFEEIFQPVDVPAFESGVTEMELLQTLINMFQNSGVDPQIRY